jgi:acetyl-CoA carboxylase carboxyl transferase subunit alpha
MAQRDGEPLTFEAPLQELKKRIEELLRNAGEAPEMQTLLRPMQEQYRQVEKQLYENLNPWNTVELARHPKRPQTRDYIHLAFDEFEEIHGDRSFRDDLAIVTGFGRLGAHRVMLVGQHKGRTVEERHLSHAGCTHPEGYWKAMRKMRLAEKYGLPVVTFIDTKGAYPGIGSEERGVAIAIAESMLLMSQLRVPVVCVVIGEGGSGGALGIGVGNRVLMLRHAYYSVISPEGCASILWRDGGKKALAAEALHLTSRDLRDFGLVDDIVEEPLGGAHRDPEKMGRTLRDTISRHLDELRALSGDELEAQRFEKFRAMGEFLENQTLPEPPPPPEPEEEPQEESGEETDPAAPGEGEEMPADEESPADENEDGPATGEDEEPPRESDA